MTRERLIEELTRADAVARDAAERLRAALEKRAELAGALGSDAPAADADRRRARQVLAVAALQLAGVCGRALRRRRRGERVGRGVRRAGRGDRRRARVRVAVAHAAGAAALPDAARSVRADRAEPAAMSDDFNRWGMRCRTCGWRRNIPLGVDGQHADLGHGLEAHGLGTDKPRELRNDNARAAARARRRGRRRRAGALRSRRRLHSGPAGRDRARTRLDARTMLIRLTHN